MDADVQVKYRRRAALFTDRGILQLAHDLLEHPRTIFDCDCELAKKYAELNRKLEAN